MRVCGTIAAQKLTKYDLKFAKIVFLWILGSNNDKKLYINIYF